MSETIKLHVQRTTLGGESCELILTAMDGSNRVWRRQYQDHATFGFDALELGLIEKRPAVQGDSDGSVSRLRTEVELDPDRLTRYKFSGY